MLRRRLPLLFVLGLAVAAFAVEGFVLLRTAKVDEEHIYRQELKMKSDGIELTFLGKVTERITTVEGDIITSTMTMRPEKMTVEGEEIDLTDTDEMVEKSTFTAKSNGETVKIEQEASDDEDKDAEASLEEDYRIAQVLSVILDASPRKIGDKWTVALKASDNGARVGSATYEVVSEETVAGIDCLKVSIDSKETEGETPMEATGHQWIAKQGGLNVKSDFKVKNLPILGEVLEATILTELAP